MNILVINCSPVKDGATAEITPVLSASRGRRGSFGINQDNAYEYKIFIQKRL